MTLDMILERTCNLMIGKKGCVDCTNAISYYIDNDMCFAYCPQEIHGDVVEEVKARYGAKQEFPIIFIGKRYIGTFENLKNERND